MTTDTVKVGSLPFLGPPQVPILTGFHYVRVARVDGTQVHVTVIDPDGEHDDDRLDPLDAAIVKRRLVSDSEIVGYSMNGGEPLLHLRYADGALKLVLQQPPNIVKVDWIDYALQVNEQCVPISNGGSGEVAGEASTTDQAIPEAAPATPEATTAALTTDFTKIDSTPAPAPTPATVTSTETSGTGTGSCKRRMRS
ncbi:hypothetical protein PI124_g4687 [Phytophthora idaei]|nr:hypothetical protein PI124_g4687 [Phytophthora idaei]